MVYITQSLRIFVAQSQKCVRARLFDINITQFFSLQDAHPLQLLSLQGVGYGPDNILDFIINMIIINGCDKSLL